jgi:hypothetical protein
MGSDVLRRVRWGNVARAVGVVVVVAAVVAWPRLTPPQPMVPGPEARPLVTDPPQGLDPRSDRKSRRPESRAGRPGTDARRREGRAGRSARDVRRRKSRAGRSVTDVWRRKRAERPGADARRPGVGRRRPGGDVHEGANPAPSAPAPAPVSMPGPEPAPPDTDPAQTEFGFEGP